VGKFKSRASYFTNPIDPHSTSPPEGVGKMIYKALFEGYPPFTVNVVFATGSSHLGKPGLYTDPKSIWFNNFVGYYEVDCLKSKWERPFGYDENGKVYNEDVIRLGKADWDYFSNYIYGVPIQEVSKFLSLDCVEKLENRVQIDNKWWDFVECHQVPSSSAYVTSASKLEDRNAFFTAIWRLSFGEPHPREDYPNDFFPQKMSGQYLVSYLEDYDSELNDTVYKTFIFGGSTNEGYSNHAENREFKEAQMQSVTKIIRKHYPNLGFDD